MSIPISLHTNALRNDMDFCFQFEVATMFDSLNWLHDLSRTNIPWDVNQLKNGK